MGACTTFHEEAFLIEKGKRKMIDFEKSFEENPEFKEKYNALTDEEKRQLTEAAETAERVVNNLLPTIKEVANWMVKLCEKIISAYPNRRVIHLAVRSKKARVRKKNMHRIIKDVQKWAAYEEIGEKIRRSE